MANVLDALNTGVYDFMDLTTDRMTKTFIIILYTYQGITKHVCVCVSGCVCA